MERVLGTLSGFSNENGSSATPRSSQIQSCVSFQYQLHSKLYDLLLVYRTSLVEASGIFNYFLLRFLKILSLVRCDLIKTV